MNTLSRINSPSIDIEDFINGMSWDNAAEVQINLAALANGIRLLHEAILKNLVVPEAVDFNLLTRNLQASDPMLKIQDFGRFFDDPDTWSSFAIQRDCRRFKFAS